MLESVALMHFPTFLPGGGSGNGWWWRGAVGCLRGSWESRFPVTWPGQHSKR